MVIPLLFAAVALGGFNRTPVLEGVASSVAGAPAHVMCAATLADWEAGKEAAGLDGNVWGWTNFAQSNVFIHPNGCRILRLLVLQKPVTAPLTLKAGFALTLTHESLHVFGLRDEGVTECTAIHRLPGVLTRFFHVKPGKQLRAWMAAAWVVHRSEPPDYQTVC